MFNSIVKTCTFFSVGNCLIEAKLKPTHGRGLVIDMLAILRMLILRMRTAGKLIFKQYQKLGGRTLVFQILCETIYMYLVSGGEGHLDTNLKFFV